MLDPPRAEKHFFPAYFSARWNGHFSARKLFWWDLTVVGSFVNVYLGMFSLILLAKGSDGWVWLALHLMLIPYNLFLVCSVFRNAGSRAMHRGGSIVWFGCALLI